MINVQIFGRFINILYNVRVLDQFCPPVVPCYATENTVRIGNWFIYKPHTRHYNHIFHSYTFTQFTNTTL
jgi:hypothetical protein